MPLQRLSPGQVFANDFRVTRQLAESPAAAVYAVDQLSAGRPRALKLFDPSVAPDPNSRQRFVQGAQAASRVQGEGAVEIQGANVDEATGTPWVVMELLEGQDLGAMMASRGRLAANEASSLFEQLGQALAAAQAAGLAHGHLEPASVFLAQPRRAGVPFTVKLLGLGVPRAPRPHAVDSAMWGAPESAQSDQPRPQWDVWSLGMLAFWTLTGRHYWRAANEPGPTAQSVGAEHYQGASEPARARAAQYGADSALPPAFDAWFARCTARDPSARFADANEAARALAPVLQGATASAPPAPPPSAPPSKPNFAATMAMDMPPPGGAAPWAPPSAPSSPSPMMGASSSGAFPPAPGQTGGFAPLSTGAPAPSPFGPPSGPGAPMMTGGAFGAGSPPGWSPPGGGGWPPNPATSAGAKRAGGPNKKVLIGGAVGALLLIAGIGTAVALNSGDDEGDGPAQTASAAGPVSVNGSTTPQLGPPPSPPPASAPPPPYVPPAVPPTAPTDPNAAGLANACVGTWAGMGRYGERIVLTVTPVANGRCGVATTTETGSMNRTCTGPLQDCTVTGGRLTATRPGTWSTGYTCTHPIVLTCNGETGTADETYNLQPGGVVHFTTRRAR